MQSEAAQWASVGVGDCSSEQTPKPSVTSVARGETHVFSGEKGFLAFKVGLELGSDSTYWHLRSFCWLS